MTDLKIFIAGKVSRGKFGGFIKLSGNYFLKETSKQKKRHQQKTDTYKQQIKFFLENRKIYRGKFFSFSIHLISS